MGDGSDRPVDEDISVDFESEQEIAAVDPADPMLSTLESAADGSLPTFSSGDKPKVGGAKDAEPVSVEPDSPSPGSTSAEGVASKPPRPPPRSKRPTPALISSIPSSSKLPPPRKKLSSVGERMISSAPPRKKPPSSGALPVSNNAPASIPASTSRKGSTPPRPRTGPPRAVSQPTSGIASDQELPSGAGIAAPRVPSIRGRAPTSPGISRSKTPVSLSGGGRAAPPLGSQPPTATPPYGSRPPAGADSAASSGVSSAGMPHDSAADLPTDIASEPFGSDDLAKTQKLERAADVLGADMVGEPSADTEPMSGDDDLRGGTRRRRSRKGKRRTFKIPDDSIPQTPTPRAVETKEKADDDSFDFAATVQRPMVKPAAADDEIYDAPTQLRTPPEVEALRARMAMLPDPAAADEDAEDDGSDLAATQVVAAAGPIASTNAAGATPMQIPDPAPTLVMEEEDGDPEDTSARDSTLHRESAPGVFTDASIGVLRPIQVVSDLPAMQSAAKEDSKPPPPKKTTDPNIHSSRRPLPPPRAKQTSEAELAEIEEIIPDRMSLPGPRADTAPDVAESPMPGAAVEPTTPAVTIEPVQTDLAVAEARAREAEAKAQALEAKARAAAAKVTKSRPPQKPWYQVIFEDELIRTFDNPKKQDVERESTFIEQSLNLEKGSRILDLGCGTGVHAVELAARGYQVVGVDLSGTMLKLAQDYNASRGTSVSFIHGDMRKLNLEGVFDGIYCWSASFGYFDETQNAEVLERVSRALRPGGMFALDVPNRDFVAPNSPSMAWFEKAGVVCMDETKFDYFTSRLHTKRMVLFDTGKSREVEMSVRLYTLTELGRLLQKVGFDVLEVSGHRAHRGAYFGSCSPRTIVVSRRRAEDG